MCHLRRGFVTSLAILATLAGFSPSAHAAVSSYPVRSFFLSYTDEGYETHTGGQATFYNRSVVVEGTQRSQGASLIGCRYTKASWEGVARYTGIVCDDVASYSLLLPADVVGGAGYVDVSFFVYDQSRGTSYLVRSTRLVR
jgi:hypothetical protein